MTRRISVNLLGLADLRQGGAALSAQRLLEDLRFHDEVSVTVLAGDQVASQLRVVAPHATVRAVCSPPQSIGARAAAAVRSVRDPSAFHAHTDATGLLDDADVVHYPLGFMEGPGHGRPRSIVAPDIQHIDLPANFSRTDRLLRAARWHRAWKAADVVLTYSEFVRERLIAVIGIDAARIRVVGESCDPRLFQQAPEPIPEPFVLYPASPLPHKDHATLLRAFSVVAASRPDVRLKLPGPIGHQWEPVRKLAESLQLGSRIDVGMNLGTEELHRAYATAAVMAFPSKYEGFGIPVLEALASGCPVAAARTPTALEIAGPAADYFEPGDHAELARLIVATLDLSPAGRRERSERGQLRAQAFTPERKTRLTLRALGSVVR